MPIRYHHDQALHRVTLTVEGELTLDDLTTAADRQAADGAWTHPVLLDVRGRTGGPLTVAIVRGLIAHNDLLKPRYGRPGPIAIVPRDPVPFGIARLFEILSAVRTERDINVCGTMEQALVWLDRRRL